MFGSKHSVGFRHNYKLQFYVERLVKTLNGIVEVDELRQFVDQSDYEGRVKNYVQLLKSQLSENEQFTVSSFAMEKTLKNERQGNMMVRSTQDYLIEFGVGSKFQKFDDIPNSVTKLDVFGRGFQNNLIKVVVSEASLSEANAEIDWNKKARIFELGRENQGYFSINGAFTHI